MNKPRDVGKHGSHRELKKVYRWCRVCVGVGDAGGSEWLEENLDRR